MLYILYGPNDFSLQETLAEIKKEIGDGEWAEINTTKLEGEGLSPEQFISACSTIPFLTSQRLVIVEGLLGILGRKDKKADFAKWKFLKDYLLTIPESTVLVFVEKDLKKSNPLLKILAPNAKLREFSLPKSRELENWILSRMKEKRGEISPAALKTLINLVGNNLWALNSEIEKLCLYAQGRPVDEDDVRLLAGQVREANIFALVDAIMERKMREALTLLHQLLDEGATTPYLLFMITRQFRLAIKARELLAEKIPLSELGGRVGLTSEYALRKTIAQARQRSSEEMEEIYRQLLDTDIFIKTGKLKDELALDALVVSLCQKTRSRNISLPS